MVNHFIIEELVSEDVFKLLGSNAWKLFDPKILETLSSIRSFFNKSILVNNWKFGGELMERGYRSQLTHVGAKHSMHKLGRALDLNVQGLTAEETRQAIISNRNKFPFITRMEANVKWVHFDNKDIEQNEIYIFNG